MSMEERNGHYGLRWTVLLGHGDVPLSCSTNVATRDGHEEDGTWWRPIVDAYRRLKFGAAQWHCTKRHGGTNVRMGSI